MATGEWIHDYLNRSSGGGNAIKRNKSINNGQRLYVAAQGMQPPSSVDNKKNIKRSWTISSKKSTDRVKRELETVFVPQMFVPENGQSWQRVGCLLFHVLTRT